MGLPFHQALSRMGTIKQTFWLYFLLFMHHLFHTENKEAATVLLTGSIGVPSAIHEIYAKKWQIISMSLYVNHLQRSLNITKYRWRQTRGRIAVWVLNIHHALKCTFDNGLGKMVESLMNWASVHADTSKTSALLYFSPYR